MFYFLYKTVLLHGRQQQPSKIKAFKIPNLQNQSISTTTSNQQSFTVSYLINTCGLSPESAVSASKVVNFETPDKPDSVIALLKNHGFSEPQITSFVKKRPCLLTSDVEKTLLPKSMFFNSRGISSTDLVKLLSRNPSILTISLENKIIPSIDFLSNMFKSDNDILKALNSFPRILSYDFDSYILPNSNVLRQNGVPEDNIVKVLRRIPKTLFSTPVMFKEYVEKVKKIGINPERFNFVLAVYVLGSMSKSTWDRKFDVYKKCGWSEEEIFEAFKNHPLAMAFSEDKIKAVMDFVVNVMGLQASFVTKYPNLLGLSMEKRIVPRGLFVKDLTSKGFLAEKDSGSLMNLVCSEKLFLERFVYRNGEKASELLKLYNEKVNLAARGKLLQTVPKLES